MRGATAAAVAAAAGAAGDCAAGCMRHRRLHPTDGSCAEACIDATTMCCSVTNPNKCSRGIFAAQARLEPGRCAHLGWSVRTDNTTTMAEVQHAWREAWGIPVDHDAPLCPAFAMVGFETFARPDGTEPRQCLPYHRVDDGVCAEACLQDNWNLRGSRQCPLWKMVQVGGLRKGPCESVGFVVDQRRSVEEELGDGQCGVAEYDLFSRAEAIPAPRQPEQELHEAAGVVKLKAPGTNRSDDRAPPSPPPPLIRAAAPAGRWAARHARRS